MVLDLTSETVLSSTSTGETPEYEYDQKALQIGQHQPVRRCRIFTKPEAAAMRRLFREFCSYMVGWLGYFALDQMGGAPEQPGPNPDRHGYPLFCGCVVSGRCLRVIGSVAAIE